MDEQARADAMADAATLRRFADEAWNNYERYTDDAATLPLLLDRAACRKLGGYLTRMMNQGRYGAVRVLVSDAAHAAFRAVPGLRG